MVPGETISDYVPRVALFTNHLLEYNGVPIPGDHSTELEAAAEREAEQGRPCVPYCFRNMQTMRNCWEVPPQGFDICQKFPFVCRPLATNMCERLPFLCGVPPSWQVPIRRNRKKAGFVDLCEVYPSICQEACSMHPETCFSKVPLSLAYKTKKCGLRGTDCRTKNCCGGLVCKLVRKKMPSYCRVRPRNKFCRVTVKPQCVARPMNRGCPAYCSKPKSQLSRRQKMQCRNCCKDFCYLAYTKQKQWQRKQCARSC